MKKALVIGINDYGDSIAPLKYCINDANAMTTLLETNGDGSPNFEVVSKTDIKKKSELKASIKDLFSGNSDIALLYFSGHGHLNEFGGFILAPDSTKNDEGVSMDEILIMANKSETKNCIIILDCCYAGALGESPIASGKDVHFSEGITLLAACRSREPAVEVDEHGIFTGLLLDALQGGAANILGSITPGSIYAYVDQALGAWEQRPVFKTNITRFVVLREIAPSVPKEILRRLVVYFPHASDEFQLDPTYEFMNTEVAIAENVEKLKELQRMNRVGLLVPVDTTDMYFAAMESKSCKLTALGFHYWRLVKSKKI
jgi:uncharacterized caspase-like protein